jgi:histidine ammonia-lyase
LSTNAAVRQEVQKSSDAIASKVKSGKSIYGVTAGVGGSGEIEI